MEKPSCAGPVGTENKTSFLLFLVPFAFKTLGSIIVVLAVGFWVAGGDWESNAFGIAVLVALLIFGIAAHHAKSELMSWWVRYMSRKQ